MGTIHFIGGEKGGVGKSVMSRLLAQYCIDRTIPFVAVDADPSNRTLLRFYRDYTRTVDLMRIESIDEIFGLAMEGDRRVLVDLPAQGERALSAWIAEAGIFDLANESGVKLVFWHVMDDGKDSLLALARLIGRYGAAARYVVVKNLARGKDFSLLSSSETQTQALALGAKIIELPELQESVMRKVDRVDASFWGAAHNQGAGSDSITRIDSQRIKVWLQATFDQLTPLAEIF